MKLRATGKKKQRTLNKGKLTNAETVSAIRLCSIIDYDNRAAKHSNDELYEMYRLYCSAGLKAIHAMEVSAFTLDKCTAENPPKQSIVDGLKLIKGGY